MKNKDYDVIKKIKEANDDIDKLNELLNNVSKFHKNANDLFEKINSKIDYIVYINALKIQNNMNGKVPFHALSYKDKILVFKMLIDAINNYKQYIIMKNIEENTLKMQ